MDIQIANKIVQPCTYWNPPSTFAFIPCTGEDLLLTAELIARTTASLVCNFGLTPSKPASLRHTFTNTSRTTARHNGNITNHAHTSASTCPSIASRANSRLRYHTKQCELGFESMNLAPPILRAGLLPGEDGHDWSLVRVLNGWWVISYPNDYALSKLN